MSVCVSVCVSVCECVCECVCVHACMLSPQVDVFERQQPEGL